nr:LysM peptidoglycan-binding domain-containing protein [bacterium]
MKSIKRLRVISPVRFGMFLFVVFVLVSLLVLTVTVRAGQQAQGVEVTVQSGDTLWQLARPYCPGRRDARDYIAYVMEVNGLQSTVIYPGQVIMFP